MSTQESNNNSLSDSDANQSSTSGIAGGSTGARASGKGKEGSTSIGTYDTSSTGNTHSGEQIDSFNGAIPNTQTKSKSNTILLKFI
ncbi:unnamed protein product [Adineta steineri]|uniref:Uncharacterized protein n=1 Tax=Adineta steineri TaxID=433720 RepID=A0A819ISG0_9BILA|nr:unnamed protein product [Adineta steineri]